METGGAGETKPDQSEAFQMTRDIADKLDRGERIDMAKSQQADCHLLIPPVNNMLQLLKSLSAPLLSLAILIMGSGFLNTFVSFFLDIQGFKPQEIGIVTSALYVGILIGSFRIDRWISKVGHIRAFVVFASLLALLVLAQGFWVNCWYWSGLRVIGGICMAGIFIVIESWLLVQSAPHLRGAILSIYLAVFYAALSSGQLLIDLADPNGPLPFLIIAALFILSVLPITLQKIEEPALKEHVRLSLSQIFRMSPLGFMGGIISGMLLAAIYGLVPVYASEKGMNASEIGFFMAILILGGFSLQWPMGRWADRGNRRKVLNLASFATAFLSLAIALLDSTSPFLQYALAWLFGGFSFTLYPLSMAYTCEKVKENQIVAATGGFVLSYGIGAIAGPLLAPLAMNALGVSGLFYFLATISLLLGLAGLKQPAPDKCYKDITE